MDKTFNPDCVNCSYLSNLGRCNSVRSEHYAREVLKNGTRVCGSHYSPRNPVAAPREKAPA